MCSIWFSLPPCAGQVTPDLYPLFIQVRPHLSDPVIRNWGRWGAGACNGSTQPPAKQRCPMLNPKKTPHVIYIPEILPELSTNSAMENRCVRRQALVSPASPFFDAAADHVTESHRTIAILSAAVKIKHGSQSGNYLLLEQPRGEKTQPRPHSLCNLATDQLLAGGACCRTPPPLSAEISTLLVSQQRRANLPGFPQPSS